MGKEIVFYYDVICPYAYLASKFIKDLANRNGATLLWRPVLLGGIYKMTKTKDMHVPDNKMILTYSNQKRKILAQDLAMLYSRFKVPISTFNVPDIRTLNAMRLVASTPSESSKLRENLTNILFDAIWQHQKDVSDLNILQDLADAAEYDINVRNLVNDSSHVARQKLIDNTAEAVQRGAFGVPCVWVNNRLCFGGDRFFLVEKELGNSDAQPHRMLSSPTSGTEKMKLAIYLDFSSPWTYLAVKQIPALIASLSPIKIEVEYVPVLVGALFKEIGTPMVPMRSMSPNKRNYQFKDFNDWLKYYGIDNFQFSSHFPIKTVLPLRLSIVNPEYKMIEKIFDATWCDDKDVSQKNVIHELLTSMGLDAKKLIDQAEHEHVKNQLRVNTQRALDAGVCGVPSFQVNNGPVVWGQDRMNIVADMLLGWKFNYEYFGQNSKL